MKAKVITIGISLSKKTPIESVGSLFKNEDGVFNIPSNEEDAKSKAWLGSVPQEVYFVSSECKITANDYYIMWSIGKQDYELRRSRNGEWPKCPHAKIVATTDKNLGLPLIQKTFLFEFFNGQGNFEEVELETIENCVLKINSENEVVIVQPKIEKVEVEKEPIIKINLTKEEVLTAKFIKSLLKIEGYLIESKSDINRNVNYMPNSVYNRMLKIKDCLLYDIKELSKTIEI